MPKHPKDWSPMKIERVEIPVELVRAAFELASITAPHAISVMEAYRVTYEGESVLALLAPGSSRAVVSIRGGRELERFYDVKTVRDVINALLAL
jgi:hypothetical protein